MRHFESGRRIHAYDISRKGRVLYTINLDESSLNLTKIPGYISIGKILNFYVRNPFHVFFVRTFLLLFFDHGPTLDFFQIFNIRFWKGLRWLCSDSKYGPQRVMIAFCFGVLMNMYRVFQLDMLHFKRLLGHQKCTFKS